MGKQRRRMTISAKTEHHEIDPTTRSSEGDSEGNVSVMLRGIVDGLNFCYPSIHSAGADFERPQQSIVGHLIVAFLGIRRNIAFVPEEEPDLVPLNRLSVLGSKFFVTLS